MTFWTLIIFYAVCFVPIVVMFALLPYIGRKTLCFGVNIPSGEYNNKELASLRKKFAAGVTAAGIGLTAAYTVLLVFMPAEAAVFILAAILVLYLVITSAIYLRMWRRVKAVKEISGWQAAHEVMVADTRFRRNRAVSPVWFVGYALIITATVLTGLLMYGSMPGQVIQRVDLQGNVLSTVPKSIGLVFFAPSMQAVMSIVFALVFWMLLRTPPVLDPDNPEATSRQNAIFRYRWSAYTVFGGMILLIVFLVMQLGITQVISFYVQLWAPLIGTGALVIGALALAAATGQSGSRVKAGIKTEGKTLRRDDDRFWKWGAIYVNKDDPALMVEKRFGIGLTMNFGRPAVLAIIAGFILFIAVSVALAALLVK